MIDSLDSLDRTMRKSAPSKTARLPQLLAGLCLAACALSIGGCKSQDAAINLIIRGQFLPTSIDTLVLDVLEKDSKLTLTHQTYPFVPPKNSLPTSVVIVQAGAAHPTLKINALLLKDSRVVGRGTIEADFVDGKTIDIPIDVLPN